MNKFHKQLKSLGYGAIIKYRGQIYCFCQGMEGDILMNVKDRGMWHFISHPEYQQQNWKKYKVLFQPN